MSRAAFGGMITVAALLPSVWLTDGLFLRISIPSGLPMPIDGYYEIGIPVLLFTGIPTLFIVFMVIEATGHVRERNPPS